MIKSSCLGLSRASTSSFKSYQRTWMPGTNPAMTQKRRDDGEFADDHRRQTGAAAAASPEMAVVRQARTDPDDPLRGPVFRLLSVGNGGYRHANHRPPLAVAAGSHVNTVHLRDFHRRRGCHPPQRSSVPDGDLRGAAW